MLTCMCIHTRTHFTFFLCVWSVYMYMYKSVMEVTSVTWDYRWSVGLTWVLELLGPMPERYAWLTAEPSLHPPIHSLNISSQCPDLIQPYDPSCHATDDLCFQAGRKNFKFPSLFAVILTPPTHCLLRTFYIIKNYLSKEVPFNGIKVADVLCQTIDNFL